MSLQSTLPVAPTPSELPGKRPTIGSLARMLGLSRATVSSALRGVGRIAPATVKRVRSAARTSHYDCSPMASILMSDIASLRTHKFRGSLGAIKLDDGYDGVDVRYHREVFRGARERAQDLGFSFELFTVGRQGVTFERLHRILTHRSVEGVMLLPSWSVPNCMELPWQNYASVYTDYMMAFPHLHHVCCHHYRVVIEVLHRVLALGYRRPGLIIDRDRDMRVGYQFSSAYQAFQLNQPEIAGVPPLLSTRADAAEFRKWFCHHKPDVVLAHDGTAVLGWMQDCDAVIPQTHGFASLNTSLTSRHCSGVDQQPSEIGRRAAELLISLLRRGERGIPECPMNTLVGPRWVDGPTLRHQT